MAATTFLALVGPVAAGSTQDDRMFFAVLLGVSALSVMASANRTRFERQEGRLLAEIIERAEVDGLTGCAIVRVFRRRSNQEIARSARNARPLSLLMVDVDRFKAVNDTCGHPVGDRVLAAIGAVLRSNSRSFDLAGRLGGDEFAVLMPDTDTSAAIALADRIQAELARSVKVPVTVSMGISGLNRSKTTIDQMLSDADEALYEVKRAGGNGVATRHPLPPWLSHSPDASAA
jgi:diguanylate cyclase (GGDEF)-like protein